MPELLPIIITPDVHPYAIRLSQAYRPHTPIPSRQELLETKYEPSSFFNLKDLCDDVGVDYDERMKTTKDT